MNSAALLQFLGGDEVGFLGGVHRRHFVHFASHFHGFGGCADGEFGVEITIVAAVQGDAGYLKRGKTLLLDVEFVGADRHGSEGEIAVGIGDGVTLRTGLRVLQNDFRLRDHGLGLVCHDTRQRRVNTLRGEICCQDRCKRESNQESLHIG